MHYNYDHKLLVEAFGRIKMPINNLQMATAVCLARNRTLEKYQLMVVPAGQGKGRIWVSIAYLVLMNSQENVHVIFCNEGLKARDDAEFAGFWAFHKAHRPKETQRLKYSTDFNGIKANKKTTVIVDEFDALAFKDVKSFWNKTKHPNLQIICLTATADDGDPEGIER